MMAFLHLFSICCFISAVLSAQPMPLECPENEVTTMTTRCDNCPNVGSCSRSEIGISGSNCLLGYKRNVMKKCVPEAMCNMEVQANAKATTCACSRDCGFTIDKCPMFCTSGWLCNPGYYKDESGNCTHPNECPMLKTSPPECPINEVPCAERGCDEYCQGAGECDMSKASQPGCRCLDGYMRNKKGDCVKETLCDLECDENSEPHECACSRDRDQKIDHCPKTCTKGCRCKYGYCWKSGKCVHPNEC